MRTTIATPVAQRQIVVVRRKAQPQSPMPPVRASALLMPKTEPSASTQTLDDYLMFWLRTYKQGLVKPTTYDTLERTIRDYIRPWLGGVPVGSLNAETIQGHLAFLKAQKGYSHSTIKKTYDCLNAAYKHGVKRRVLSENPMELVEMPSKALFQQSEMTVFSATECALIIEECSRAYSTGRPVYTYGDAVVLILLTGIRLGEAIGLKREDYDPEKKTIKIRSNVQKVRKRDENGDLLPGRVLEETTTKTYSGFREIPLTKQAVAAVERMLQEHPCSSYLICTTKGERATPEQVDRTFRYLLRNLNLGVAGVHKLRHTFASLLFSMKVDVKTISKLLGHASVGITLQTYIHISEQVPHEVITPLDELF